MCTSNYNNWMPSTQYYEGRIFEKNTLLFEHVQQYFQLDAIISDGSSGTKSDIIGLKKDNSVHFSLKYASGGNTQVHLPTLRSLSEQLEFPTTLYDKLDRFLGTNDSQQWQAWTQNITTSNIENKYKRLTSYSIIDWQEVIDWYNQNTRKVAKLLLQRLDSKHPVQYLIWAVKNRGTFQVIDVNKFIDYIETNCEWITMPRGTVIRCQRRDNQRPVFFMQMKNSGGPPGAYNHSPQFHLCSNWPQDLVVYEKTNLQF